MRASTFAFVALVCATGCHRNGGANGSNEGAPASGAPSLLSRQHEVDNDKLIAWLKAKADTSPAAGGRERLIEIYRKRGQMRGRLDDFDNCIHYATQMVDLMHSASSYKMRARCEISLHQFAKASDDLDAASHHRDEDPADTGGLRGDVAWALGRYDDAENFYTKNLRKEDPSALARAANFFTELGRFDDADRLFADAEKARPKADGLFASWLETQRALRALETGDFTEAKKRLAEARELDPKNAPAEQIAAQVLSFDGKHEEAKAAWKALVDRTDSPEHMSWLARELRATGDDAGAKDLAAKAKARYDADLAAFPEAVWQHYGNFLLENHFDAKDARAILEKDAAARPAASSWIPLIWAELACGDATAARATLAKALATPVKSARLYWTAARVSEVSGDAAAAATWRKKAAAIDPRIADRMAALDWIGTHPAN